MIKEADLVKYICSGYERGCFQRRNQWMVDHASRVIAVHNGEPGGTYHTIQYAQFRGVCVVAIGDISK